MPEIGKEKGQSLTPRGKAPHRGRHHMDALRGLRSIMLEAKVQIQVEKGGLTQSECDTWNRQVKKWRTESAQISNSTQGRRVFGAQNDLDPKLQDGQIKMMERGLEEERQERMDEYPNELVSQENSSMEMILEAARWRVDLLWEKEQVDAVAAVEDARKVKLVDGR